MVEITPRIIVLGIILVYSRFLFLMRYKFRSTVYNEKSWKISFRPWFLKEIKALFSNKYFKKNQMKIAWGYRIYLIGYVTLWTIFKFV